jgi:hypothetical protein
MNGDVKIGAKERAQAVGTTIRLVVSGRGDCADSLG